MYSVRIVSGDSLLEEIAIVNDLRVEPCPTCGTPREIMERAEVPGWLAKLDGTELDKATTRSTDPLANSVRASIEAQLRLKERARSESVDRSDMRLVVVEG